ncbi:hypothetical protein M9H77_26768 [Catharanthus roseus]|uniref:Uncharacterized protein n=1 Tax=Catharanthus roseus TaxID=4058 RepID=A0ACC0AC55_CATRO|nr:hypothetical protein M9H77_26768 [Catharanthus roseus]
MGKSSGSGSGSSSGSGSGSNPSPRGRGRPPRSRRKIVLNVVGDGTCGFKVVSNFLFGDENHWIEIRRRMSYDLRQHMHIYEQLFGSVECVTESNTDKLGRGFSATRVLDEYT